MSSREITRTEWAVRYVHPFTLTERIEWKATEQAAREWAAKQAQVLSIAREERVLDY